MLKKLLSITLCICALTVLLAGCGNGDAGPAQVPAESAAPTASATPDSSPSASGSALPAPSPSAPNSAAPAENTADEETKAAIERTLLNLTFEKVEESYGYKTYRGVLENTSGVDLESICYTIDLIDSSGAVVEHAYASLYTAYNGEKYDVTFATDKDFEKYELRVDYLILKN